MKGVSAGRNETFTRSSSLNSFGMGCARLLGTLDDKEYYRLEFDDDLRRAVGE